MKKSLSFLLLCMFSFSSLSAQEYYKFLLNNFEKGKVIFTNGESKEAMLNYEMVSEIMVFLLPDSTIWELAQPEAIASISIGDRVFEHVKKGIFYEKVKTGNGYMYVRWKSDAVSKGTETVYGHISSTGSVTNYSQTMMGGKSLVYLKPLTERFEIVPRNMYYLKINNKFKRFSSFNALAKLFKKHKASVREYVKTEKLDFNKQGDVERVVARFSGLN